MPRLKGFNLACEDTRRVISLEKLAAVLKIGGILHAVQVEMVKNVAGRSSRQVSRVRGTN